MINTILKGLVLAGGKSTRMGRSKARICWHGKEQQYHLADLLSSFCDEVFISCRKDQQHKIDFNYKVLPDLHEDSGPMEAILTAFKKYPDQSWMVVACDLPLLDKLTLDYLIKKRETSKIATVFESPVDGLPEPLIAIWEPMSYNLLKSSYQTKQLSLRKILLVNEVKIIKAPNADALINVNTPAEAEQIRLKHAFFIR
ncbi:MAG: molybdenum cofactor guanylyltransferase [Janthinobacterium lividum]